MKKFKKEDGIIEQAIEDIIGQVNEMIDVIKKLEKKNEVLKEELDAPVDERLAEAHAKIKELEETNRKLRRNSLYILSESERQKANEFWREHKDTCPHKARSMKWVLSPTGIGTGISYVCSCGEEIDLTDTSMW